jgi:hypothetical protein
LLPTPLRWLLELKQESASQGYYEDIPMCTQVTDGAVQVKDICVAEGGLPSLLFHPCLRLKAGLF